MTKTRQSARQSGRVTTAKSLKGWWARQGLNLRPLRCQGKAPPPKLLIFNGTARRTAAEHGIEMPGFRVSHASVLFAERSPPQANTLEAGQVPSGSEGNQ
jgi:hypothetical protein